MFSLTIVIINDPLRSGGAVTVCMQKMKIPYQESATMMAAKTCLISASVVASVVCSGVSWRVTDPMP